MNLRKTSVSLLATAAAVTAVSSGAFANSPIAGFLNTSPSATDVQFTTGAGGGLGGTLMTMPATGVAVFANGNNATSGLVNALFNFGPITQTGAATVGSGGAIEAIFSGGNFSLLPAAGGTPLLTGTFTSSKVSTNGSSGSAINLGLNSVTYTGGTYYNSFLAANPGPFVIGNLSVSLAAINPNVTILAGGGLSSFDAAASSGTFDAITVPEPGEIAFAVTFGAGLVGLVVRNRFAVRRNKKGAVAAA